MNTIELHIALDNVKSHYPELFEVKTDEQIVKAVLYAGGSLEAVEFLTSADKRDIIRIYQLLKEADLIMSSSVMAAGSNEPDVKETTKVRKFKRGEMIDYLKLKLQQSYPDIEFINLKYNVLTCRKDERIFTIYVSTSRDYEHLNDISEINPSRVAAWHKGEINIFRSYDYYAMLVKLDNDSQYETDTEHQIEGLFMSQERLNEWLNLKERNQSGMINCYLRYIQTEGRKNIKVVDARERPELSLDEYYQYDYQL